MGILFKQIEFFQILFLYNQINIKRTDFAWKSIFCQLLAGVCFVTNFRAMDRLK